MNRFVKALMVVVPVSLISLGFYLKNEEAGEDILMRVVVENLKQIHYNPPEINDAFSVNAYDSYLENIDPGKRFLLQSDVDALAKHKLDIDDQTLNGSYAFFNESVDILNKRTKVIQSFYKELLDKPFDFKVDESVDFSEDIPYAKTDEELRERWRTYLKYNVMTRLASAMDVQESAKNNVVEVEETEVPEDMLMDEVEPIEPVTASKEIKSYETLEQEARKAVLKTNDEWFERLARLDRKDRMATYINSITVLYDPHTNYFPPADKDNFDIRMSGRLEGIGAQLQEKDGYIKVVSIVPGSPSAMQGELQANDLILKVAQGKLDPVDVVNARIDDAVKIIRGKKGTEVRLTVQKPDGMVKVIPIIRDVIVLEETYAKSVILNDKDKLKVGYLNLPSFYTDFSDNNGRTSWKDVKAELKKLKKDGAQALIFDLRNNGGGSLQDVVEMAGLFIPKGPIVQVKARFSDPHVMTDHNSEVEWDKPVIIMVNEFSASASEILAAALQDYNRAIIVGSKQTHGKGTVQRFAELNQSIRSNEMPDMGALKITTQKFYRVNGGATQLKGVTPDIIWPDNYAYLNTGESEQKNAMPWDKIDAASYVPTNTIKKMEVIIKASEKRTKDNPIFAGIEENAKRWKTQNDTKTQTLNIEKYRAEQKTRKSENDVFMQLFKNYDDLLIANLSVDAPTIESDTLKSKRAADWHKSLKKDVYLYESLQIAENLIGGVK